MVIAETGSHFAIAQNLRTTAREVAHVGAPPGVKATPDEIEDAIALTDRANEEVALEIAENGFTFNGEKKPAPEEG